MNMTEFFDSQVDEIYRQEIKDNINLTNRSFGIIIHAVGRDIRVTTRSKASWPSIGGTKLAFQRQYRHVFTSHYYAVYGDYPDTAEISEFWRHFWDKKIFEVIPV